MHTILSSPINFLRPKRVVVCALFPGGGQFSAEEIRLFSVYALRRKIGMRACFL